MISLWKPVVVFALFGAAMALSLLDLESFLSAEAATVTILAATVGASLTAFIWPQKPGAKGGAIIVFLAYPLTWFGCMIGAVAEHGSGGAIFLWIVAYAIDGVTSLVLTGWVAIPAGALLGYLLNRRSSKTGAKPTANPWVPSQTHGCI
jgi:hypothetical protein